MEYYPIFVNLKGRCCLVVGDGNLSEQKADALRSAGAEVVRSSVFNEELARLAYLIVADVGEEEAEVIRRYGEDHRVFVNIVDKTPHCSFIVPAMIERGDLIIAISSSGRSPALSSWIRRSLEQQFGGHFAALLGVLGESRQRVKSRLPSYQQRKDFYRRVFEEGLIETARVQGEEAAREQLEESLRRFET